MGPTTRSTNLDRLMILVVVLLVASPVLYWLISPVGWAYASALEKQKSGDFSEAEREFLRILEKNAHHSMALFRLGELAYEKEDFDSALQYAESSLMVAKPQQKPAIINLQSNSLTALKKPRRAVEAVKKLYEFTTLPKEYEKLSAEELLPFLSNPANRHFLNSLAYMMAINKIDLHRAESYIDSVIVYYEQNADLVRITAPYLYERASQYQSAFDSLQFELTQVQKELEEDALETDPGARSRVLSRFTKSSPDSKDWTRQFRSSRKTVNQLSHYVINNRLKLLAEKLENGKSKFFSDEMKRYSELVKAKDSRFELNDDLFLQYAFELQHYLDTRAMIRLFLGEEQIARAIQKRDRNVIEFLELCDAASENFRAGYRDLLSAIAMKSSTAAYLEKYPENSLMISLPNDLVSSERNENRIQAIEHYHRYLLLNSLGRIEEAETYLEKIEPLGYQPGPQLF